MKDELDSLWHAPQTSLNHAYTYAYTVNVCMHVCMHVCVCLCLCVCQHELIRGLHGIFDLG